jgi:hypothetical protein
LASGYISGSEQRTYADFGSDGHDLHGSLELRRRKGDKALKLSSSH